MNRRLLILPNRNFGHHSGMKYLYSSPDSARIGLVQSALEAVGIECELRNQAVSQVEIGIPFYPELWVLRDEDHESARDILKSISPSAAT